MNLQKTFAYFFATKIKNYKRICFIESVRKFAFGWSCWDVHIVDVVVVVVVDRKQLQIRNSRDWSVWELNRSCGTLDICPGNRGVGSCHPSFLMSVDRGVLSCQPPYLKFREEYGINLLLFPAPRRTFWRYNENILQKGKWKFTIWPEYKHFLATN